MKLGFGFGTAHPHVPRGTNVKKKVPSARMVLRISLMVIISRLIDELRKFLWCNQFETGQRELDEFIALDASELTGRNWIQMSRTGYNAHITGRMTGVRKDRSRCG